MPDLTLDLRYPKYAVQVAEAGSFAERRSAYRYRNPPSADVCSCLSANSAFLSSKRTRAGAGLTPEGERFLQQAVVGARFTFVTLATEIRLRGNSRLGS